MRIRCWGARGSIPVSGPQFIRYGGDTTCIEIRAASGDIIIVDAGTGIRQLGNRLVQEGRRDIHLIFTHSHWDHILGFPFFKPYYRRDTRIFMYRCPYSGFVREILTTLFNPPYFPVEYSEPSAETVFVEDFINGEEFRIGSVHIQAIPLSHPNTGRGYKFTENGRSFVFLTDNELGYTHPLGLRPEEYRKFCQGVDFLVHDAEYLPEEYPQFVHWGHSTYTDALRLALEADVGILGLFHHNQDRTDDQVDHILSRCRAMIEERGSGLVCVAMHTGFEIEL